MKPECILIAVIAVTASCTHVYYAPNTANAPLLSQKGETRINALYSAGGTSEFTGGELQMAHAISKNFAVIANGMAVSRSDEVSTWDLDPNWNIVGETHTEKGKGSYIEFAGGYFKVLDKNKKIVFETYAGVGFGTANNDYGYGGQSKVNSTKILLQPSIGCKSKYVEMAFVPKLSFVNWKWKESAELSTTNNYASGELLAIKNKPGFVAFEPAVIFRAGAKNFKVQAALSYSATQFNSDSQMQDLTEDLNASIGISINLKSVKK